jgi:hypothetical protein
LPSRSRAFAIPSLALGILALNGCALSPLASRTASFSTAANKTIAQTSNAYDAVNQIYFDAEAETLVATFDTAGFHPDKIKPFIPAKDLEVRTKVLMSLKQYADLLAEIAGDKPIADMETKAKAVSDSVKGLQADDLNGLKITDTEREAGVTALATLGAVLIEHQRARALPGILAKANPPIQTICAIFEKDIGTATTPGLINELKNSYSQIIDAREKFIQDNASKMDPIAKRAEIETLPMLVLAEQQSTAALNATSQALVQLAAAHAALAATAKAKDAPAFRTALSELVQDGEKIDSFYSKLQPATSK